MRTDSNYNYEADGNSERFFLTQAALNCLYIET